MTTTKIIYLIGTVMPCGVLLLAAFAIYRAMQRRRVASAPTHS
jgi:hypothetical protein